MSEPTTVQRSRLANVLIVAAAVFACTAFAALGTWQLYRLQWKRALIERVDQRVHASPVAAPTPAVWSQINRQDDEYRHIQLSGTFLHDRTTQVHASTVLGTGFWVMTPLQNNIDGSIVLINRGFIAAPEKVRSRVTDSSVEAFTAATQSQQHTVSFSAPTVPSSGTDHRVAQPVTVTGLLRMSEPGGAMLRSNDPINNRWYSRDIEQIASVHNLPKASVAPYFVDMDAAQNPRVQAAEQNHLAVVLNKKDGALEPIGGLTVISFYNNHLVYALTWYTLAFMVVGACFWVRRTNRLNRE